MTEPLPWEGRVLDDRYRIVEKLGEGGMGAVFIAEHLKLGKRVALKVVLPEFAGDGEMAARFAREAMATAQIEHPHVASAIDYGTLPEGGAFLVMQLVKGRSLRALLEAETKLPWGRVCTLGAQVADALAAAHAQGIVHRDLKPENVLLEARDDGSDHARVLDFGIARVAGDERGALEGQKPGHALTRVGTIIGTPGYMAPEQAMGERVDARADLYALGVMLWEAICGRTLWSGEDITAVFTRQLTETPPLLRVASQDASIPEGLEALVAQLLARSRNERTERASLARDALKQLSFGALAASGGFVASSPSLPSPVPSPPVPGAASVGVLPTLRSGVEAHDATAPSPLASLDRRLRTAIGGSAVERVPAPFVALGALAVPLLTCVVFGALVSAVIGASSTPPAPSAPPDPTVVVTHVPLPIAPPAVPTGVAPPPAAAPTLEEELTALREGNDRAQRRAAEAILARDPATVPPYASLAAELESARGCPAKKRVLERVAALADPRSLPFLDVLSRSPRRGCGFLNSQDCLGCLRRDLGDLREALGAPTP